MNKLKEWATITKTGQNEVTVTIILPAPTRNTKHDPVPDLRYGVGQIVEMLKSEGHNVSKQLSGPSHILNYRGAARRTSSWSFETASQVRAPKPEPSKEKKAPSPPVKKTIDKNKKA